MYDFGIEEKEFQLMLDVANEKMELNSITFNLVSDTMRRVRDSGKLDDYTRAQVGLLCDDFSIATEKFSGKTEYEVAIEEMSGGMMALVAAAVGVVLGILIKIVSMFGGGSSGGSGGGGSSPTKEEHKQVNETNYEASKTVLNTYEIISSSNIEGIKEVQKETLEKYMKKQDIDELQNIIFYVGTTHNSLHEKIISDIAVVGNKKSNIHYASTALGVIKYIWDKIIDKSLNKENINEILSKVNSEDIVKYSDNKLTIDLIGIKEELIRSKQEIDSSLESNKVESSNVDMMQVVGAITKTLNEQGLFKLKSDRSNILETSNTLNKIVQTIKDLQSNIEKNKDIDISSDFNVGIINGLKEGLNNVLTIYSVIGSIFVILEKLGNSVEKYILNTARFIGSYMDKIKGIMDKETDNAKKDLLKKHLDEVMNSTNTITHFSSSVIRVKGDGLAKKFTLTNSLNRVITTNSD